MDFVFGDEVLQVRMLDVEGYTTAHRTRGTVDTASLRTVRKPCTRSSNPHTQTHMKYDLVLYGATGFTGQLVAAYLRTVPDLQGKRWAIAGRSASRLAALEAKLGLGAGVGLITAELTDAAATADLVASTKAVINCAGPFSQHHAEELLGECARSGTHYSDLAGEGFWQAEMATKFHAAAEKSGAKIVLGGGVDSIPSDLGCMLAIDALLASNDLPESDPIRVQGVYSEYSGR